jgi:hypothetical protein
MRRRRRTCTLPPSTAGESGKEECGGCATSINGPTPAFTARGALTRGRWAHANCVGVDHDRGHAPALAPALHIAHSQSTARGCRPPPAQAPLGASPASCPPAATTASAGARSRRRTRRPWTASTRPPRLWTSSRILSRLPCPGTASSPCPAHQVRPSFPACLSPSSHATLHFRSHAGPAFSSRHPEAQASLVDALRHLHPLLPAPVHAAQGEPPRRIV